MYPIGMKARTVFSLYVEVDLAVVGDGGTGLTHYDQPSRSGAWIARDVLFNHRYRGFEHHYRVATEPH